VSFDRAAGFYDRTRVTDPEAIRGAIDLLHRELGGLGLVAEIGVGTGALALSLAQRGVPLVGLDLSATMMQELVSKSGGVMPFPLVQADATRLPFADASLGGAFARWVLHLIPNWRDAVTELCRAVRSGGRVILEPGGYGGEWRRLWQRFVDVAGELAAPVGLDVRGGHADLDEAFASCGATCRELPPVAMRVQSSPRRFFEETAERRYSWTWRLPDDELRTAVDRVRRWAAKEFGDLDAPFEPEVGMHWRAYDIE